VRRDVLKNAPCAGLALVKARIKAPLLINDNSASENNTFSSPLEILMENQPQNIIAIGRKRFPIEEIALVEPFQPPAEPSPRFASDKDFKARVVLIDRYNVLTEDTVEAFAEANKFRRLPDDNVATNPMVRFRVETFEPSEGFEPRKPYQSRLKWRDQDGNEQSKLLLTKPETVIAVVLRGEAAPAPDDAQQTPSEAPAPPRRARRPAAPGIQPG
jgi:hypothetical protein